MVRKTKGKIGKVLVEEQLSQTKPIAFPFRDRYLRPPLSTTSGNRNSNLEKVVGGHSDPFEELLAAVVREKTKHTNI
jgi:hypothetical protein